MKYLTARDLMKRYDISCQSCVSDRVISGKLPRPDKTGKHGAYLWSEETITNWERTHGGSVHMFKAFLKFHSANFAKFLESFPLYRKQIESLQEDGDSQQIEFSEPELIPESNSSSDGERRINEVLDSFNLAAPEANNHNSDNEIFYPSKTIVDYDVHEKITQVSKDIAALSSRVIAFAGEIDSLRDSVHTLIKIVSILTNAQRNSSGLLYGQIKAALVLLTALEKEFNIDELSPFTKPGE